MYLLRLLSISSFWQVLQSQNCKVLPSTFNTSEFGQEDVSFTTKPFNEITDALEGVISSLAHTLQKVKPDKASVKFGMELAIEAGQLTAVIVKGSSKANLEITLEWS